MDLYDGSLERKVLVHLRALVCRVRRLAAIFWHGESGYEYVLYLRSDLRVEDDHAKTF